MNTHTEHHLKAGGDPRTLADYIALREEMNKLTHPARPDVNWQQVENLCLSLFEHSGVDLQSGAWYTLARAQQAGLTGMNEGLRILDNLISRHWDNLWPHPARARTDILGALGKRLQQVMRTLTLTTTDPGELQQAQAHLNAMAQRLQGLELKQAGELEALRSLIHSAAARFEKSENRPQTDVNVLDEVGVPAGLCEPTEQDIARPKPPVQGEYINESQVPARPRKPFAAGMLTMLALAVIAGWSWRALNPPEPAVFATEQPPSLPQHSAETGIRQTQQALTRLSQLKPDWAISYGDNLVQQAHRLWPEQAKPLVQQWQQQLTATVLPPEKMRGWHQGMMQLEQLANRLNALDEQKGKYITVSELKSAVFAMSQSFNSATPAEEELRKLAEIAQGQPWPAAQQTQMEQHLQQLIVRYALLKAKKDE